jgi:hypothetical protein
MFNKLLGDIDNEYMEDMFDILIVTALVDADRPKTKKVFIDQVDL